jgi:phosphatidylinositol alpha-1,6-mannosyltransferase
MNSPRVSIVILNRNRSADLVECLDSVFRNTYPDFEVILVDNASEDASIGTVRAWAERHMAAGWESSTSGSARKPMVWTEVEIVAHDTLDDDELARYPELLTRSSLTIVACKSNLGYAGGHNIGMAIALRRGAAYILLLNSDVIVESGFLDPLIDQAKRPDVGAAGPLVLDYFDRSVVWQAGARVHAGRGWVEGLGKGREAEAFPDVPREVDAVVGCALLLKAEALQQVGPMDTDYFLYLEETDWLVRASGHAWKTILVPRSKVWHKESALSMQAKSIHSSYYFARNRLMFVQKNFPRLLPLALIWSLRYGILNNLACRRWWQLGMSLLGIWDFLKGRRGMRASVRHVTADLPGVLVFSVDYKPQPGGIAEHTYRVATGFHRLGAWVTVLAPRYGRFRGFDRDQAFDTYRVPRLPGIDWVFYFFVLLYLVLARKIGLVYCATSHPCALICLLVKALAFFKFTVSFHAHEVVYSSHGLRQRIKKGLKPLHIRVVSSAVRVYAVSRFTREALIHAGVDEAKTATIFNGVDAEELRSAPANDELVRRLGLTGRRIILTVARLDVHKGHDVVIRSFPEILKKVPEAVYVIAGDGKMRAHLEELAMTTGVGDHIIVTGLLPRADVIALYKACDVFVMISRVQNGSAEGFGIAFLEAAAFGKPAVGGRSGGIPDAVLEGVTGLLVDPENPAEVADAVTRILRDAELASRLGEAGYDRVRSQFTWDMIVDRILTALRS